MNANYKVVRDVRVANAILVRVAKLNNCKGELYAHPQYKAAYLGIILM